MKNPQDLIGRKVKNIYGEEEIGTIDKYQKDGYFFIVKFNYGSVYNYPADQIEAHLVEDEIPTLSDGVMMLVSDDDKYYEPREVYFKYNEKYYVKPRLTMELTTFRYAKPIEQTKEEKLTAILGSSEKVSEIMELFKNE